MRVLVRMGLIAAFCSVASGCSCGNDVIIKDSDGGRLSGDGGSDGGPGSSRDAGPMLPTVFADFPLDPVIGTGAPANAKDLFAGADQTGAGPCLAEPTLGALIPFNWTPLYMEWSSANQLNLFEIRLHVDNQTNDYVTYVTGSTFELTGTVWAALTQHSYGHDVTISLRGAQLNGTTLAAGPFLGAKGPVHLAPTGAAGTIVYWTTSNGSALKGFDVGQKTAKLVLSPDNNGLPGSQHTCVGCHTSAPDGALAFFTGGHVVSGGDNTFSIDAWTVDGTKMRANASQITPSALALLARPNQDLPTLSIAHYGPGDAVALSTYNNAADTNGKFELVWTDLHATSDAKGTGWGIIARTGDANQAAVPSFGRTGQRIAYVSSTEVFDGRTNDKPTDIYTVPYNNRAGGAATPVPGASDPSFSEYYPAFSPDDSLLAFNRVAANTPTYNAPNAEVYLVPAAGGTATRSVANDPPACTGQASPGLTNSWPRWAPEVQHIGTKKYYWLTFSSQRRPAVAGTTHPQIYIQGVVVEDGSGAITTYPALYVRSQEPGESNHTPAWDVFQIGIN